MAKGIDHLGNTEGYIYIVDSSGTSLIKTLDNSQENAKSIRLEGLKSASLALNQRPYAKITVATVTGAGQINSITVNGVNQIDTTAPIIYGLADGVTGIAVFIRDAINSYTANTSEDYTAYTDGSDVYITGEAAIGSSHNGLIPIVTVTVNSTYTITDVVGGSDANSLINESYGNTFWLDANYNASGCTGLGSALADNFSNAVQITEFIVPRMFNSAMEQQSISVSSGHLSIAKASSVTTLIIIDTEAAAGADDLDSISSAGVADGSIVILRGRSDLKIVTVKSGTSNISLEGNVDFATGGTETALTLQLIDSTWYEVSRTTDSVGAMAAYRAAGHGFFGVDTFATQVVAGGTTTFVGGTSPKYQTLTGTVALASNAIYDLQVAGAVNGDEIWLSYNASVTNGAFNTTIFNITLTDDQALIGGLLFHAKFMSGGWHSNVYADLNNGLTNKYRIPTELYGAGTVDAAAVETTLKTETITRRVSFEAGEQCDNTITMGYPGSVVSIFFSVDSVIAGSDAGMITPKDNANVAMTNGLISVTASASLDSIFTTAGVIGGANTFVDGDVLKFTSAKSSNGGFGTLSIKVLKA
tara:strand:+ start:2125 stop:3885 length:1761 start_codon:yes stop_codon:yes gene_type:complete